MDDLFFTGKAKYTSGSISFTWKNGDKLVKKLAKLKQGSEKAIRRAVSDFSSRAPGWVSKGIRQYYGVDTAAIKEAGPKRGKMATKVKVAGISVDGATLEYSGRTLTPLHFKMSPKSRQTKREKTPIRIPGQAISGDPLYAMIRPPKEYTVKATIIKGGRDRMKEGTFLATANGATIPFQRTGADRMPIEAVRTLSVPQMIDGRAHDTISQLIQENMEIRFNNHIKQAIR